MLLCTLFLNSPGGHEGHPNHSMSTQNPAAQLLLLKLLFQLRQIVAFEDVVDNIIRLSLSRRFGGREFLVEGVKGQTPVSL